LPYGSQQTDRATANAAHAANPEDPQFNKGAMAHPVKPLAVCKLEKQSYNMGSQLKDHKVIRSGWTLCIE